MATIRSDFIHVDEREKIFRLVQYATRLIWALQEKTDNGEETVKKLKQIESMIVLSRQTLRFGKFIEALNSSLHSMRIQNNVLRTTLSLSRISYGLYLLCDNLIWLSKIGILGSDQKRSAKFANSFLLYYSILTLSKNFYCLKKNYDYHELLSNTQEWKTSDFLMKNKLLLLMIVKDFCDILMCLDSLNKIRLTSSKIGILGMTSSIIFMLKKYIKY